jgi:hypothetical protein
MLDHALRDMEAQAVDLGKAREQSMTKDAARALAAQRAAEDQVARWEKGMQRAFKGIVARPHRRRMLDRAVERAGV